MFPHLQCVFVGGTSFYFQMQSQSQGADIEMRGTEAFPVPGRCAKSFFNFHLEWKWPTNGTINKGNKVLGVN